MDVLIEDERAAVVTVDDRQRLRGVVASLRASLPPSGAPYGGYLRALEARLERLATVTREGVDDDVVTMNSRLHVRELDTGATHVVTLCYPWDADAFGANLSVLAPLGGALLGSRVGDVVEWQTDRGPRRPVRVERILF